MKAKVEGLGHYCLVLNMTIHITAGEIVCQPAPGLSDSRR